MSKQQQEEEPFQLKVSNRVMTVSVEQVVQPDWPGWQVGKKSWCQLHPHSPFSPISNHGGPPARLGVHVSGEHLVGFGCRARHRLRLWSVRRWLSPCNLLIVQLSNSLISRSERTSFGHPNSPVCQLGLWCFVRWTLRFLVRFLHPWHTDNWLHLQDVNLNHRTSQSGF